MHITFQPKRHHSSAPRFNCGVSLTAHHSAALAKTNTWLQGKRIRHTKIVCLHSLHANTIETRTSERVVSVRGTISQLNSNEMEHKQWHSDRQTMSVCAANSAKTPHGRKTTTAWIKWIERESTYFLRSNIAGRMLLTIVVFNIHGQFHANQKRSTFLTKRKFE